MSISLVVESLLEEEINGQHVWPLKITATSSTQGLSSKIFVYHASGDEDPYSGDLFECVASAQQMDEIPEDAPAQINATISIPYYRSDELQFNCRSPEEAESLLVDIQEDVQDLLDNFTASVNLTQQQTIIITPTAS